jgi:tetratricopeptide (TPR) repeat protein
MPRPEAYPLIDYYRGYCLEAMMEPFDAAYDAASGKPTTYVFPNRPQTLSVLRSALAHNPDDGTAHYLLGSLYLSGGMAAEALAEWESARLLRPELPVLHRNMAYTILNSGGSPAEAAALFRQGTVVDSYNTGVYVGLEEAMNRAGSSAGERADALLTYPDLAEMPASLVYKLARLLAEAERFDEAESLFRDRFFPRREGGINVREVYLEVRLARALALARRGESGSAREILEHLGDEVPGLPFTRDGLDAFIESRPFQERIAAVRRLIGRPPPA